MTTLLTFALSYAARGWYVLPIHSAIQGRCSCRHPRCPTPGKHPIIKDWANTASIDAVTIRQWWGQWPHANVGILTGTRSGLGVLDIDPRNGGDFALDDLLQTHGPLPETPLVLSGGGGLHYYCALDAPLGKFDPAPGINLQGDGALVVAPPSRHASGRCYEWEASSDPDDLPLTPLPAWLKAMGAARGQTQVAGVALPAVLPPVRLQDLKVSTRIKFVIQTGEDPDDRTRYAYPTGAPDRSPALFAVIQALVAAGYDDDVIASVVLDARYAISAKVLSQSNPKNPRYADQTRAWVAKEIARARTKHQAQRPLPGRTGPGPDQDDMAHLLHQGDQQRPPGQRHPAPVNAWLGPRHTWHGVPLQVRRIKK